jgi:SH3-like domain-containing protein
MPVLWSAPAIRKKGGMTILQRLLILPALLLSTSAMAADNGFPVWKSLRDPVVNMRVGPGEDYAIRFVYHRQNMPIKVLRAYQGWYFVEDSDGARGWIMMRFLNKTRTALVRGKDTVEMRNAPGGALLWRLSPGVVGRIGECKDGWCLFDVDKHTGFVPQDRLWGASNP